MPFGQQTRFPFHYKEIIRWLSVNSCLRGWHDWSINNKRWKNWENKVARVGESNSRQNTISLLSRGQFLKNYSLPGTINLIPEFLFENRSTERHFRCWIYIFKLLTYLQQLQKLFPITVKGPVCLTWRRYGAPHRPSTAFWQRDDLEAWNQLCFQTAQTETGKKHWSDFSGLFIYFKSLFY